MKVTYEKKGKVGWITFNRPEIMERVSGTN
jgi:enoyl-CoA hydratase/carnithine racemase